MKLSSSTLVLLYLSISLEQAAPCPFARTGANHPVDEVHSGLHQKNSIRHRRMVSLSDDPGTKQKLNSIINNRKHRSLTETCLSTQTYDNIDADIANLADAFADNVTKGFFLGGLVRLAAHDFLDYNVNATADAYGPDGCIDFASPENAGLDQIWCDECDLTAVWEASYSHISRADFWVAAANAVIRHTSSDGLDLKNSFVWGRIDRDVCPNSAERLPAATNCAEVEEVFLDRLGLSYTDAVALIGAHTLGRGDADFSGHDGIWVDTVEESLVFDKRFFEELIRRPWVPRNIDTDVQDWTWGGRNGDSPRFMLNTDMCLLFDIEQMFPCCSRTDRLNNNGVNQCQELSEMECLAYEESNPRKAAADAVELFATGGGNGIGNTNNQPFYDAFETAWAKATTNGWTNLNSLDTCVTSSPTTSSTSNPLRQPSLSPTASSTSSPSAAPSTAVPTVAPVTSSPSAAPVTSSPSAAPVTSSPSAAPVTSSPSVAPSTSTPSAAPVTASPISSPATSSPVAGTTYPKARVLKLYSSTGQPINMYEFRVISSGVNVAEGKRAMQSSTLWNKFPASYAVDGNANTFSHTEFAGYNWFQIDLEDSFDIESVEIANRWCGNVNDANACLCRLSYAVLSVYDDSGEWITTVSLGNMCGTIEWSHDFSDYSSSSCTAWS